MLTILVVIGAKAQKNVFTEKFLHIYETSINKLEK